jgi:hypothetical protein
MRIRTLKPEFWTHPVISRLSDSTKLLAIALLNYADDHGYFYADCRMVRAALRPLDEDSTIVRRSLAELVKAEWIEIREHPTHGELGKVLTFTTHQRVDRPSPSKISTYWLDEQSSNVRRGLDDHSSLEQGTGNREQGNKGTGKGEVASAPVLIVPTELNRLEFMNEWEQWIKFRKSKGGVKDWLALFQSQLEKLSELTVEQAIECVNHSRTNGYTGIFPKNFQTKSKSIHTPEANQVQETITIPLLKL